VGGVPSAKKGEGKIAVRTPNVPGYKGRVDAAKYRAMERILLSVLPRGEVGLSQSEMFAAVEKVAEKETFPGTTYAWWAKCVQLDLEARGKVKRLKTKPLTWVRS
jgi:hypothetical protein